MALMITIKVVPSSRKQVCKMDKSGIIKCYLKNPPEKGLANKELIQMLAKKLNLPQSSIHLVNGASVRTKTIKIEHTLSLSEFYQYLEIQEPSIQQSLFCDPK